MTCSRCGGVAFDALPCEIRDPIVLHAIRLVGMASICTCALASARTEVSTGDNSN